MSSVDLSSSASSLANLLKPQLKDLCRERGLNVSGTKSDLVSVLACMFWLEDE